MSDEEFAALTCLNSSNNDSGMLLSCMVAASVAIKTVLEAPASSNRLGRSARPRIRRTVEDVLDVMGDIFFRRAYQMSYQSFLQLNIKLAPGIMLALDNKRHMNTKKIPLQFQMGKFLRL